MVKAFLRHNGLIAFCLFSGCVLFFLSFQYARMTSFPIGDDPAIHINIIKNQSLADLRTGIYPIPLSLYKIAYQATGINAARLFTIMISSFLFLSGVVLFVFIAKGFGSLPAALTGSIFFVTDRWVNDSLRMGTLSEVFGWSVLFFALTALLSRQKIAALIFSALLIFSHPFAFIVYTIILILYTLIVYLGSNEDDRKFLMRFITASLIICSVISVFNPDVLLQFLRFRVGDAPGWGERTLWQIFVNDNAKRMVIPLLAIFGLSASLKSWGKPAVKLSILLLLVGLFMSLNHMIGIQFLPFRFYAYLMAGVAILAGVGLITLLNGLRLPQWSIVIAAFVIALYFAWPSYQVNAGYLNWQKNDPSANASMQPYDLAAIDWIGKNTPPESYIVAERRYGIWIRAIGDRQNIIFYYGDRKRTLEIVTEVVKQAPVYIYVPKKNSLSLDQINSDQPVYNSDEITIYKVNL